jgi:hypothetical protein
MSVDLSATYPDWQPGMVVMMSATYREKATGRLMKMEAASVMDNSLTLTPAGEDWEGTSQQFAETFEFVGPWQAPETGDPLPKAPLDLTAGRDETWGQGIFGSGQKAAYDEFSAGKPFDTNLRFMNADYMSGYQQEWRRLRKLKEDYGK